MLDPIKLLSLCTGVKDYAPSHPLANIDHNGSDGYRATDGKILCVIGAYKEDRPLAARYLEPGSMRQTSVSGGDFPALASVFARASHGSTVDPSSFLAWMQEAMPAHKASRASLEAAYKSDLQAYRIACADRSHRIKAATLAVDRERAMIKAACKGQPIRVREEVERKSVQLHALKREQAAAVDAGRPPMPVEPLPLAMSAIACPLVGPMLGYAYGYLSILRKSGMLADPACALRSNAGMLHVHVGCVDLIIMPCSMPT